MSGSQALGNSVSRTPGCAVGVVTGAIAGGVLGAVGRALVAIRFFYVVAQSDGEFFPGGSSESLSDVIELQTGLIVTSAVIGCVVCGLAGATCRVLLAAPIGAVLSAMPCFVLVVVPSTFLMSMSGGNTEPDVHAVWVALMGMAVVGAMGGAGGAIMGRLAMKGVWRRSAVVNSTSALPWYARPDRLWLIFCVTVCVALLSATAAAIFTFISTTGHVFYSGGVFVLVLVAWLLLAGAAAAFGLLKTMFSVADQDEKVAYETFAKSVSGRIHQNRRLFSSRTRAIEFLHHGFRVVVDTEQQGAGRDSLQYTRVTLGLPRPTLFQCVVSPHGMFNTVGKPGHQEIQLGSSVFDDEFRTLTNNQKLAVQILNVTVQSRLMQLTKFSKTIRTNPTVPGRVVFLIDSQRIQIRVLGVISKLDEMTELHRQFSELLDALLPRLGHTP